MSTRARRLSVLCHTIRGVRQLTDGVRAFKSQGRALG